MDESQTLTQRILKGSSIVLLFALVTSPIGYFLRILYSQTLSIEMYGLFYAVLALFNTIAIYNDLGFGYSVSYLVPKYLKNNDHFLCWLIYKYDQIIEVCTSVIISSILIILAPFLAKDYFKMPEATNLIYILCIYLIVNSFLSALNKFFTGLQQEIFYSSMQVIRLTFTLVFSLLFWFFDKPDILFYAISLAAAYVVTCMIYNYLLYKNNRHFSKHKLIWNKEIFSSMYAYAVPTLVTTSLFSFITFTDTFFLILFKGVTEVGVYNVILPLVSISSIFISPINALFFPLISHLMEDEQEKITFLLDSVLKIIPFIALYFGLFIFLFPSAPIQLLFGEKWVGLAETPLRVLAFGFIAAALSSYLTTIVSGMGKVKERLRISIAIAIISVVLNAVLIFKYGILGAVIANSIVYLISVLLFGRIIQSSIPFKYPLFYYLQLLVISVSSFFTIRYFQLNPSGWLEFILYGIIYTVLFLILGLYLAVVDKNTLKIILKKQ